MLIVLCGPSGVGKSITADNLGVPRVPTCTTRLPRLGEIDGRDYFFLSEEEFKAKQLAGDFLEVAQVHGNWYGSSKSSITNYLQEYGNAAIILDVQGVRSLRNTHIPHFPIFLKPPEPWQDTLKQRLIKRGDTPESVQRRLKTAEAEMTAIGEFNCLVVAETVERTIEEVKNLCHLE